MKRTNFILFALILLLSSGQHLSAQESLPYKTKAEFKRDTLQSGAKATVTLDTLRYLEYNFTSRSPQYKGKKVAEVLKDLDLPILYIVECTFLTERQQERMVTRVKALSLAVGKVGDKPSALKDYYIVIYFEDPLTPAEFMEVSGFSRDNHTPVFTQKLYDFIKDRTVSYVTSNPYIIANREWLKKKSETGVNSSTGR